MVPVFRVGDLEFFYGELSEWEKEKSASQFLQMPRPDAFKPEKPGQPDFKPVSVLLLLVSPAFSVFIKKRHWLIFHLLDFYMPYTWLSLPTSSGR